MHPATIGQVSRQAGVAIETIRFYEREGLLDPARRSEGGFRLYGADAVQRLRFIRQAKELGFALGEIKELLSIGQGSVGGCADVRSRALRKLAEVDRKIDGLLQIRTALSMLSESCPGEGPVDDCPILGSLQRGR